VVGSLRPRITENIVEHIVERVFIDEEHIYPDLDLGICDLLEDGSLLIVGQTILRLVHSDETGWELKDRSLQLSEEPF
jgi:hypothetical protein